MTIRWRWLANRAALFVLLTFYLLTLYRYFGLHQWGNDARSYWSAWEGGLYDIPWHGDGIDRGAYVYSPAFAEFLWLFTLVPWPAFYVVFTALQVATLVLLCGPILGAVLLALWRPVVQEVAGGNIDLFMGIAIAIGLRYPASWSFVLLTKVTPGVGLAWFAIRREWRPLAVALGVTGAIVAVSLLIAPALWLDWGRLLLNSPETTPLPSAYVLIQWPLIARLAIAFAMVGWGAFTDRPWTILVAAYVASPLPTATRTTMLLGLLPMLGYGPLARWLRSDQAVDDRPNDVSVAGAQRLGSGQL